MREIWIFKYKHSIAINNGTSALDIILSALEIKRGDEVIVPSLTYISTNVVLYRIQNILCNSMKNFSTQIMNLLKKFQKTKLIIATDMKNNVNYDEINKIRKIYKFNNYRCEIFIKI